MTILQNELKKIVSNKIHRAKEKANLTDVQWKTLDTEKIVEEIMPEILDMLEQWAFIPCCHTSGMHDPEHFEKGEIWDCQKEEAFERLCKDLNINPITRSKIDCGWCAEYLHYRKGEGKHLFSKSLSSEGEEK